MNTLQAWEQIADENQNQKKELDRLRADNERLTKEVILGFCKIGNHADNNNGKRTCLGHECRVCDAIDDALRHINEVLGGEK